MEATKYTAPMTTMNACRRTCDGPTHLEFASRGGARADARCEATTSSTRPLEHQIGCRRRGPAEDRRFQPTHRLFHAEEPIATWIWRNNIFSRHNGTEYYRRFDLTAPLIVVLPPPKLCAKCPLFGQALPRRAAQGCAFPDCVRQHRLPPWLLRNSLSVAIPPVAAGLCPGLPSLHDL